MKNLLSSIFQPTPPPPELRDEARRVETMLDDARTEHNAALKRADNAFRDTVKITQKFIEEERRR